MRRASTTDSFILLSTDGSAVADRTGHTFTEPCVGDSAEDVVLAGRLQISVAYSEIRQGGGQTSRGRHYPTRGRPHTLKRFRQIMTFLAGAGNGLGTDYLNRYH